MATVDVKGLKIASREPITCNGRNVCNSACQLAESEELEVTGGI